MGALFSYDVCVVGGGSAGIGAALAASRAGRSVLIVEKGGELGGNAVRGGVHNWEPGVGGTAFPKEIYERMNRKPKAVGTWSIHRHVCWPGGNVPPFPGAELLLDPSMSYEDTLKRHGTKGLQQDFHKCVAQWHGVIFEPHAYTLAVEELLRETGNCEVWKHSAFLEAETSGAALTGVRVTNGGESRSVRAEVFIDCTADGLLCRSAGCESAVGEDTREVFGEPGAPLETAGQRVNALTRIYRVTRSRQSAIEPAPPDVPADCWFLNEWPVVAVGQYPSGDLNINMLPTMEGREFLAMISANPAAGYQQALIECERRIRGHWRHLQTGFPEFRSFKLSWIAPALGVRESWRIIGDYVLTEHDLRRGLPAQGHPDIIAIADHALDTHGESGRGCGELAQPYGIPLRCLLVKSSANLLVAGRCASFSHIAASSCRLSRTMMDLGHAAGLAATLAVKQSCTIRDINVAELQNLLLSHGATLDLARQALPA